MITTLINQKRGLNRFSKLPDDGDPQLFKINDIVSSRFVKTLSMNITNTQLCFVGKMLMQRIVTFYQQKIKVHLLI